MMLIALNRNRNRNRHTRIFAKYIRNQNRFEKTDPAHPNLHNAPTSYAVDYQ